MHGACSSPGELGGDAILDVLDGTFAPTGRLPVTVRVALDIYIVCFALVSC